jgi:4-hydroxymandelate oxidase
MAGNLDAWQSPAFAPRVLSGIDTIDTSVDLLGHRHLAPLLFAPTAFQSRYHPDGEVATMRAAAGTSTTYVQSSQSATPLTELGRIAREGSDGPASWWFQVYLQAERGATRAVIDEALAAGAAALVLTVDSPALGARDNDRRNSRAMWPDDGVGIHERVWNPFIARDASWADLEWLADLAGDVPVLVKGVLRADDAVEVVAHGGAGVIVSNHGARNLDTIVPTATALPSIVAAIEGRVPVLVDGGIRRGTDIARALCLGADAVLVGRPYVWGLATHGEAGVAHVAQILRAELTQTMALLGAACIADLTPGLLWPPR